MFTLDTALSQALEHNPGLKVVEAQEQEAYWAYKIGVSLPSATASLNFIGGNNPGATTNGLATDYNVAVSQSFGALRSIALTGKSAYQGWQMAKATTRQTRLTLVQNLKDAFYSLLLAQEQLRVSTENLELANRVLDTSRKRFEAGGGPRMDYLNAQVQQASAQQTSLQAIGTLKTAQSTLAPLLGMTAREPLEAKGDPSLPALDLVYSVLDRLAQGQNPSIDLAIRTLQQSETNVKLARSQYLPTPSLSYQRDLSMSQLYFIGATLSVPFDWGQIRYQIRQNQKTVEEKLHALDSARLSVSSSVKSAYDSYQSAVMNVTMFRERVVKPSEELMKMTQFGYQEGALPFLQVLNAEQTLRTARAQYYTLLLSGHQALHALEAAVGQQLQTQEEKP